MPPSPPPTGKFANLVSLKWHFLHFDIICVVFYKVFFLITNIFGLFFAVLNPSFQNQTLRSHSKQFSPCFQNFMINRENRIKIGRAGGNTSNREGWNLCLLKTIAIYYRGRQWETTSLILCLRWAACANACRTNRGWRPFCFSVAQICLVLMQESGLIFT